MIKKIIQTIVFTMFIAAPVMTLAAPQPVAALECESRVLLGMPPWYRGMTTKQANPSTGEEECVITSPDKLPGGIQTFIWKIALNIIEIGLFIVGYVALFFILYGGFQYLTNGSNPAAVQKAWMTILNAMIGLAISLGSIGIVNLLFGVFG